MQHSWPTWTRKSKFMKTGFFRWSDKFCFGYVHVSSVGFWWFGKYSPIRANTSNNYSNRTKKLSCKMLMGKRWNRSSASSTPNMLICATLTWPKFLRLHRAWNSDCSKGNAQNITQSICAPKTVRALWNGRWSINWRIWKRKHCKWCGEICRKRQFCSSIHPFSWRWCLARESW